MDVRHVQGDSSPNPSERIQKLFEAYGRYRAAPRRHADEDPRSAYLWKSVVVVSRAGGDTKLIDAQTISHDCVHYESFSRLGYWLKTLVAPEGRLTGPGNLDASTGVVLGLGAAEAHAHPWNLVSQRPRLCRSRKQQRRDHRLDGNLPD
jgi:hypothetical protein